MSNGHRINGEVTKDEKAALEKIRESTPCVHSFPDGTLIRWLRANKGDLEAASSALEKHVTFRKAWGLDGLWSDWKYGEVVEKFCGFGFTGVDKDGAPVMISMMGNMDVEGMMKSLQSQDYIKWSIRPIEEGVRRCEKLAKETGNPFEQMTLILDLENMGSSHYSYKPFTNTFLTLLNIFQEHYPLAIKKILVIKSPTMAQYAYTLLTPFLADHTNQTIEMPGDDWLDALYKYIEPDQWPAFWGGGKMDEEGTSNLPSEITLGLGPIPESYYLNGEEEMGAGAENITVYAGDKHLVELETKKSCVRLSWQYKTAAEDIGFGIFFDSKCAAETETTEMQVMYPSIRLESAIVSVSGSILCENPGRYIIEFDNYYSWFSAKELTYIIDVQEL